MATELTGVEPCAHARNCITHIWLPYLPSMKVRILLRKLHFLAKLLESEEDNLSSRVFRTIAAENVYGISQPDGTMQVAPG